jgi:hypothetical protein
VELLELVTALLDDPDEVVAEAARWAGERLTSTRARPGSGSASDEPVVEALPR